MSDHNTLNWNVSHFEVPVTNTIWLVFSTKKIPFVEGYLSSKQDQGGKKKYLNKLDIIIGLDPSKCG